MAEIRKERRAHLGLGFQWCSGEAAHRVWAPVRLRWSLDDGDATMKIGTARRSRKCGRRSRLTADQIKKRHQGDAPCRERMTGGRRGTRGHRRWRNRPEKPTVMRRSGEGFHQLQMVFARGSKGGRGRGSWGFYRWPCVGKGLGFRGLGDGRLGVTPGSARTLARGGRCPWHAGSACQWQRRIPIRGYGLLGRGPLSGSGRKLSPQPFSYFWFLFLFLFTEFWITSISFATCFKSPQTNF
jgi:hypothetical protein